VDSPKKGEIPPELGLKSKRGLKLGELNVRDDWVLKLQRVRQGSLKATFTICTDSAAREVLTQGTTYSAPIYPNSFHTIRRNVSYRQPVLHISPK